MRSPKLQPNETLRRPQDSTIYKTAVPRLSTHLLHVLKGFNPKQENLVKLYDELQMQLSLASVGVIVDAYKLGCKDVEMPEDKTIVVALKRYATSSATLAAHQITNTTANAFDLKYSFNAGMSKSQIATPARASNISLHQMGQNFYRGLRYGWQSSATSMKRSFVSSDHDKDDLCDDNEDEGAIPIDGTFQSGDYETPFHFGCECVMILVRPRERSTGKFASR